jgi:hypothetical protein
MAFVSMKPGRLGKMRVEKFVWSKRPGWRTATPGAAELVIYCGTRQALTCGTRHSGLRAMFPSAHILGCSTGGTGYSSLRYLRSFPFDKIKIDRCFIKELGDNSESDVIVRTVAGLADSLGMTTTAEGVETQEQLDRVRHLDCTDV